MFFNAVIGFTISPENQTCPQGTPAEFRCERNGAQLFWEVNGERVTKNATHEFDIIDDMHVLTIMAEPEFNESIVMCKSFDLQNVQAQLLIQG